MGDEDYSYGSNMKTAAGIAACALACALTALAPLDGAHAGGARHARAAAPPPPSIGYFGHFPLDYDSAQAQAWSLEPPYYRRRLYDYCDYRNCVLRLDGKGEWAPVWYGPVN